MVTINQKNQKGGTLDQHYRWTTPAVVRDQRISPFRKNRAYLWPFLAILAHFWYGKYPNGFRRGQGTRMDVA